MKFLKFFGVFVSCFGIFLLAGCASHSKVVKPSTQPNSLQSLVQQYQMQTQWDGVAQTVTLYYQGQRVDVLVGSALVLKNGQRIVLAQPIDRKKGVIIFPGDFVSQVLVVEADGEIKPEYIAGRFREIMIDAGHGGKDPGAISRRGVLEKDVVLDISKRLKENLEQKGIKVRMTRSRDEFISLEERTRMASRSKADFFISIHANSSRNKKVHGMEIYYSHAHSPASKPEAQQKENLETMARELNMKSDRPVVKDILMDMMLSVKSAESKELGQTVIRHASRAIDTPNRGWRACRFFVVRNTLMPAVLVEVGYLTNHKEEQALNSVSYRQKIADAITESILNYANDS